MAAASIQYSWVVTNGVVECRWALIGANGEHMCGSWPEGYRDKTDARRAVRAVMALFGAEPLTAVNQYVKERGPGPRPAPGGAK